MRVPLRALGTLWFNTGTLCNLTCRHCYIESSPKNDRLVYLTAAEVAEYLDEIESGALPTSLIGFTGGEPFMNPELTAMLEDVLSRGLAALVLTNAMKPMAKCKPALLRLRDHYSDRLTIRVSIDHYGPRVHERERGERSWQPTIDGLVWLARNGFSLHVASRRFSGEPEAVIRKGFAGLFANLGVAIDADDDRVDDFSTNGRDRRGSRNHRGVLGHPRKIAGSSDVRDLADDREAEGRYSPYGRRVHAVALRRALRARPYPRRGGRCGAAQPPPLRQVLRARRRCLQPMRKRPRVSPNR